MTSFCMDDRRRTPAARPNLAFALLRRLAALPALWRARIVARSRMQRLDDAALSDLGLRRDQVETLQRKPFWRE